MPLNVPNQEKAWVVTGPTSGLGYRTALELADRGTVVLVGRNATKLDQVKSEIEAKGGRAVAVVADLGDIVSVRRAAGEIVGLGLPVAGVLNNAGIRQVQPAKSKQGWDLSFAVNHLGPLAFTEALIPSLADGTNIVFIVSAVEDPERTIAVRFGFRGSRYLSAEATARGEYRPGGSTRPGFDSYATTKQGGLAAVFTLAREFPRLHFRAIEPGINPGTNLGGSGGAATIAKLLTPVLLLIPHVTTPTRAARVITRILTDHSDATGTYYDEDGELMRASKEVSDTLYSARYIAESRELLATVAAVDES